jgi:hypothetical protein
MISEKNLPDILAAGFVVLTLVLPAWPFEAFGGTLPGHLIGVAGSVLILMTLIYPYRKHVQGKKGRKNPLPPHIYYGLVGPILVVVHAGGELGSLIGKLLFLSMFLVVFSGIAGKFLFKRVNRTLKGAKKDLDVLKKAFEERRSELDVKTCRDYLNFGISLAWAGPDAEQVGIDRAKAEACEEFIEIARSMAETRSVIRAFDTSKKVFSYWRKLHVVLVYLLFALLGVHAAVNIYYGLRWLP